MPKRYIILEENDEGGVRTEIARAENIHVDDSGQVHARGVKDSHPEKSFSEPRGHKPHPQHAQPIQIASGNNVVTITIQVAPADYHQQQGHQHGGCGGCGKKGGCRDCQRRQAADQHEPEARRPLFGRQNRDRR